VCAYEWAWSTSKAENRHRALLILFERNLKHAAPAGPGKQMVRVLRVERQHAHSRGIQTLTWPLA
jgi:hypothetical protein